MSVEMTDTFGYHSLAPKLQIICASGQRLALKIDAFAWIQIVTAAFDWERRSPGRASTDCTPTEDPPRSSRFGVKRAITRADQWKWLAYGLFSKRARAYSALESAALNQIDALSDVDMEAFLSVLNSDHPEEVLCGTSAGVVAERNAALKRGPRSDGISLRRWRERLGGAMIPGVGGCQVQRDDLIFDLSSAIETRPGALKTLTIGFNREEHTYPRSDGLPQFLAATGSTLRDLTLDGPRQEIDENLIVRSCPSLHTLSLCGGIVARRYEGDSSYADSEPQPRVPRRSDANRSSQIRESVEETSSQAY
ncbi:hypothetical protein GQ600_15856 [Phytophthora cactorum]|nr:hypothetical protein GQ600_15856 [Phytophthora cactorum]